MAGAVWGCSDSGHTGELPTDLFENTLTPILRELIMTRGS